MTVQSVGVSIKHGYQRDSISRLVICAAAEPVREDRSGVYGGNGPGVGTKGAASSRGVISNVASAGPATGALSLKVDHRSTHHGKDNARGRIKALANDQRLMILCHLIEGQLSVSELNARVALSQSALSPHLAVLRAMALETIRGLLIGGLIVLRVHIQLIDPWLRGDIGVLGR